jgi:excisionase family DNA binding protein
MGELEAPAAEGGPDLHVRLTEREEDVVAVHGYVLAGGISMFVVFSPSSGLSPPIWGTRREIRVFRVLRLFRLRAILRWVEQPTRSMKSAKGKKRLASESGQVLEETVEFEGGEMTLTLSCEGSKAPDSILAVMKKSLQLLSEGQAVEVVGVDREGGTQEAADLLRVSRPFLVKLLDRGEIPSRKVGVQRRVLMKDVLEYREREKALRRETLGKLAAEDQGLKLGQ